MCSLPKRFLGVTKKVGDLQENITRIELDNGVSAGIRWKSLGADMVPLFEEYLAREEKGIDMKAWYDMEPMERAIVIAVRRIGNAAKNHQAEAEIKAADRKTKKK
jgi:hypothetical protein